MDLVDALRQVEGTKQKKVLSVNVSDAHNRQEAVELEKKTL